MEVIFLPSSQSISAKREHFGLIAAELKNDCQVADVGEIDWKVIKCFQVRRGQSSQQWLGLNLNFPSGFCLFIICLGVPFLRSKTTQRKCEMNDL